MLTTTAWLPYLPAISLMRSGRMSAAVLIAILSAPASAYRFAISAGLPTTRRPSICTPLTTLAPLMSSRAISRSRLMPRPPHVFLAQHAPLLAVPKRLLDRADRPHHDAEFLRLDASRVIRADGRAIQRQVLFDYLRTHSGRRNRYRDPERMVRVAHRAAMPVQHRLHRPQVHLVNGAWVRRRAVQQG